MERLNDSQETRGFSAAVLQTWGYLFVLLGIGAALIQNALLGIDGMTGQQLLELLNTPGDSMLWVTASLILQALESCAVPIFALLAVEWFSHTADWKKLAAGAALVAAVSEIPFNLAMSGRVLDLSTRNPTFGLVLALVLLWFYRYFDQKGGNTLMKVILTVAAVLWGGMLSVRHGTFLILMVAVLWYARSKPYKTLIGGLAAAAGCLISLYYVVSPISFLAVHFYNGEPGENNRVVSLISYPILLLAGYAAAILL